MQPRLPSPLARLHRLANLRAHMTRFFLLLVTVLALNACEQHKAENLPAEFRDGGEHGAAAPAPAPAEPGKP